MTRHSTLCVCCVCCVCVCVCVCCVCVCVSLIGYHYYPSLYGMGLSGPVEGLIVDLGSSLAPALLGGIDQCPPAPRNRPAINDEYNDGGDEGRTQWSMCTVHSTLKRSRMHKGTFLIMANCVLFPWIERTLKSMCVPLFRAKRLLWSACTGSHGATACEEPFSWLGAC